jgi:hypothetical protein
MNALVESKSTKKAARAKLARNLLTRRLGYSPSIGVALMLSTLTLGRIDSVSSSRRKSVVLQGTLIGSGHRARCTLSAERRKIVGLDEYEYTEIVITEAPEHLPDGRYQLAFDGRVCDVQRLRGRFINHFWSA